MLKAIGAVVVFALIVVGAIAAVVAVLSPKTRNAVKAEIKQWRKDT